MTNAIDTASGLWVKQPIGTHTYVVRQELECSALKWDTVVVTVRDFDVGIGKLEIENFKLEIYPNPAGEILNVELDLTPPLSKGEGAERDFQIINVLGNVILSQKVELKNGKAEIDVGDLKSGMYFIKVGKAVKKFVKE